MSVKEKSSSALLFLLFAIAIPAGVAAASAPEVDSPALLFRDGNDREPAPILASLIRVQVTGILARATVTQLFHNPSDQYREAVYLFPLPAGAAVDGLRLTVGERTIVGRIRPAEEAAQAFAEARECGCKAALVDQLRPNVFTAAVTQIGPGETVEVEIAFDLNVVYDLGTFQLRFPTVVAPRYEASRHEPSADREPAVEKPLPRPPMERGANPTAFRVEVAAGFPVATITSPSHAVRVTREPGHRFTVELGDELADADRDFVLEWTAEAGREPRVVSYLEEKDGDRYVLLMVIPPPIAAVAADRLPREAVLVIDTSGSMEGTKIEQARRALKLALARLRPGDRFNVVAFDDEPTALFAASRAVDPGSLEEARRFVDGLAADGGTEMVAALELALDDPEPAAELRQVVFITDGQVGNEAALFRVIKKGLGRSRLFPVGIGAAPNRYFLRRAAACGRGFATDVDPADVAGGMEALFAKIDAPLIRDLELLWDDPTAEVFPDPVGDLYLGEPLVVAARLATDSGVRIRGWRRGAPLEATLALAEPRPAAGIHKLWARRKIEALGARTSDPDDRAKVRAQIVELALDHHLVTGFTSLVAVDEVRSAPAGTEPERRLVRVSPPRDWIISGEGVEETIMVTSESPLLDNLTFSQGAALSGAELEEIPVARDLWAVLEQAPGVLVGARTGFEDAATTVLGPGATGDDNAVAVDGVAASQDAVLAAVPAILALEPYGEVRAVTAGDDVTRPSAGVTLRLITGRGTNVWQAAARYLRTGDALAGAGTADELGPGQPALAGDRVVAESDRGLAAGGPLVRDRLWAWGSWGQRRSERAAAGGSPSAVRRSGGLAKLNGQPGDDNSFVLSGSHGQADEQRRGAAPGRAPEATLEVSSEVESWSVEDTHVFTSNLYASASWTRTEGDVRARSAGEGDEAAWDDDGVLRHGARGGDDERRRSQIHLDGRYFFQTGGVNHELLYGARRRDVQEATERAWPGRNLLHVAGRNLGAPGGTFFRREVAGEVRSDRRASALWLGDTLIGNRLTGNVGLRFDRQTGSTAAGDGEVEWTTLVPRLAVTFPLADRLLLRAGWGRFAQRLGAETVARVDPAAAGEALFRFTDANGDGFWQEDEAAALVAADGFARPHVNDPGLRPAITEELLVAGEWAVRPGLMVALHLTRRRHTDVHELRDLVRDGGEIRAAGADDYVFDHFLNGTLPGGGSYSVPVYSLRPGIEDAGAALLTNGDRELVYDGVVLSLEKRLHGRFMARAHVHYGKSRWRLGEDYDRHHDPTDLAGSGDDDGALYVVPPADVDTGSARWLQSTWSGHLSGLVRIAPDRLWGFEVAASVNARQGYPLPYFVYDLGSADGLPRRVQVTEDVDAFRLDDVVTVDLRLAKEFELPGELRLTFSVDAFNLFDERVAVGREVNLSGVRGGWIEETLAARALRLGLRLSWR